MAQNCPLNCRGKRAQLSIKATLGEKNNWDNKLSAICPLKRKAKPKWA
jgi:hypothetical protein